MNRSVRQSVDPVRRGVHGPGVSVFGSPNEIPKELSREIMISSHVKITCYFHTVSIKR